MPKEEIELEPPPPKGPKPTKKPRVGAVGRTSGTSGNRGRPSSGGGERISATTAPPVTAPVTPTPAPSHLPPTIPGSTATPTIPTTHHNSIPPQVKIVILITKSVNLLIRNRSNFFLNLAGSTCFFKFWDTSSRSTPDSRSDAWYGS